MWITPYEVDVTSLNLSPFPYVNMSKIKIKFVAPQVPNWCALHLLIIHLLSFYLLLKSLFDLDMWGGHVVWSSYLDPTYPIIINNFNKWEDGRNTKKEMKHFWYVIITWSLVQWRGLSCILKASLDLRPLRPLFWPRSALIF